MKKFYSDTNFQKFYNQEILNEVESRIKKGEFEELKALIEVNEIDLATDGGHLGILAVNNSQILSYLVEKCPELISCYGIDLLTAAVWAHNDQSVSYIVNDQKVDFHELEGTNVYDYCVEALGSNFIAEIF